MRSRIAEALAQEESDRVRVLTPSQRMEMALRLGSEVERAYAALHGISRIEASRRLDAERAAGRRPCSWEP